MVRGGVAVNLETRFPAKRLRVAENGFLAYNFSMPLTIQEVEHIARLARLELTDEQKEHYRGQLSTILDHIAKLRELDTSDVPPTTSGSLTEMPLRADESRPGLATDVLLTNAPEIDSDQFKVPPVFE